MFFFVPSPRFVFKLLKWEALCWCCWKQGDPSHNYPSFQILSFLSTQMIFLFCSLNASLQPDSLLALVKTARNLIKIKVFKWGEVQGEARTFTGRSIRCCFIALGLWRSTVHLAVGSIKMQILYLHLLLTSKKDMAFVGGQWLCYSMSSFVFVPAIPVLTGTTSSDPFFVCLVAEDVCGFPYPFQEKRWLWHMSSA